jgi:uncharacterized linocin/CFP29 family protein
MDGNASELKWTDAQWETVKKTVAEEASRARVCASFLPLFGPLEPSITGVPSLVLSYQPDPELAGDMHRLCVDSEPNTMLTTISVTLALHSHEVADPELSAAVGMLRRAANVIARVEDALLFFGQPGKAQPPAAGIAHLPPIFRVSGGRAQPGLTAAQMRVPVPSTAGGEARGDATVNGVVAALNQLEAQGHAGPYACVLGHDLFSWVCTPTSSLVLPRDRILPFLEGPLLRSSTLRPDQGLLFALGGNPIEIVVGSDISVRFLQLTAEPRYLFRVSERVALRVKEWSALVALDPTVTGVQMPREPWAVPSPPARSPV